MSNLLCIPLKRNYRNISIINVHVAVEDVEEEKNDKYYETLENDDDWNTKVGKEEVCRSVAAKQRNHNETTD